MAGGNVIANRRSERPGLRVGIRYRDGLKVVRGTEADFVQRYAIADIPKGKRSLRKLMARGKQELSARNVHHYAAIKRSVTAIVELANQAGHDVANTVRFLCNLKHNGYSFEAPNLFDILSEFGITISYNSEREVNIRDCAGECSFVDDYYWTKLRYAVSEVAVKLGIPFYMEYQMRPISICKAFSCTESDLQASVQGNWSGDVYTKYAKMWGADLREPRLIQLVALPKPTPRLIKAIKAGKEAIGYDEGIQEGNLTDLMIQGVLQHRITYRLEEKLQKVILNSYHKKSFKTLIRLSGNSDKSSFAEVVVQVKNSVHEALGSDYSVLCALKLIRDYAGNYIRWQGDRLSLKSMSIEPG